MEGKIKRRTQQNIHIIFSTLAAESLRMEKRTMDKAIGPLPLLVDAGGVTL